MPKKTARPAPAKMVSAEEHLKSALIDAFAESMDYELKLTEREALEAALEVADNWRDRLDELKAEDE